MPGVFAAMILWGVAMVRNEADIVEAFVRHNLALLDGVAVIDHRSTDETPVILAALQAEGLPVVKVNTDDDGFFQGAHVSAVARECMRRAGADFVFALDADEFIRAPSRAHVENALAKLPPDGYGLNLWRSYVPTSFAGGFGAHCVRLRVRREAIPRAKVIVPRGFLDRPHDMVSEGNHWVIDTDTRSTAAHHVMAPDALCLAHCPVRSAPQLGAKAKRGYEARLAGGNGTLPHPKMSTHWRDICTFLEQGALTDERLRLIAMNYTVPPSEWSNTGDDHLVEDPLELRTARGPRGNS